MLTLRSIDPAKHRFREYVLDLQPGLFGDWCVITRWGRIGNTGGSERHSWFETEAAARQAAKRMQHGYYVETESESRRLLT